MIKNIAGLLEKIRSDIRYQTDMAVVGLSGGADSTLVAILCKLALGERNVYGIHMPYGQLDKETFNSRSRKLADKLDINQLIMPVNRIADEINNSVREGLGMGVVDVNLVNAGNSRSRARMCVLYGVAHELNQRNSLEGSPHFHKRVRVVGTGNLSEDYIGYDTKGGDALCDFFPIGELFKSEVYQLLTFFKDQGIISESHIDRVPSAGLWEGQTDEKELGYTYNEMEPQIKAILSHKTYVIGEEGTPSRNLFEFVVNRHNANKHKHEAPPVTKLREFCD